MSTVSCPQCQQPYPVQPALLGKKVRCKSCQHIFTFPAAPPAPVAELQPLSAAPAGLFGGPSVPSSSFSAAAQFSGPQAIHPGYSAAPAKATNPSASDVPPEYGPVTRQYSFGPRPVKASIAGSIAIVISLVMAAGLASGATDRLNFRNIPLPYVLYVLMPVLMVLAITLFTMLLVANIWPLRISVTTLGVYFPKNPLNRTMVFVPFSDRPAMHVEEVQFVFVTAADIRLKTPRGKFSISMNMLPSDAEFYELAELIKSRLPFT